MLFFIGGKKSTLSVTTIASDCIAIVMQCKKCIQNQPMWNRWYIQSRQRKNPEICYFRQGREKEIAWKWWKSTAAGWHELAHSHWTKLHHWANNGSVTRYTWIIFIPHTKKISFPVHLEQCVPKLSWLIRYAERGIRIRDTTKTKICATNSTFCSLVDDQLSKIW